MRAVTSASFLLAMTRQRADAGVRSSNPASSARTSASVNPASCASLTSAIASNTLESYARLPPTRRGGGVKTLFTARAVRLLGVGREIGREGPQEVARPRRSRDDQRHLVAARWNLDEDRWESRGQSARSASAGLVRPARAAGINAAAMPAANSAPAAAAKLTGSVAPNP